MVIECLFGEGNKGAAVERLRSRFGAAAVVYLGDDTTDEHAFAVLHDNDVGIKVGPGATAANHRIPNQEDVAAVFDHLRANRIT